MARKHRADGHGDGAGKAGDGSYRIEARLRCEHEKSDAADPGKTCRHAHEPDRRAEHQSRQAHDDQRLGGADSGGDAAG